MRPAVMGVRGRGGGHVSPLHVVVVVGQVIGGVEGMGGPRHEVRAGLLVVLVAHPYHHTTLLTPPLLMHRVDAAVLLTRAQTPTDRQDDAHRGEGTTRG